MQVYLVANGVAYYIGVVSGQQNTSGMCDILHMLHDFLVYSVQAFFLMAVSDTGVLVRS